MEYRGFHSLDPSKAYTLEGKLRHMKHRYVERLISKNKVKQRHIRNEERRLEEVKQKVEYKNRDKNRDKNTEKKIKYRPQSSRAHEVTLKDKAIEPTTLPTCFPNMSFRSIVGSPPQQLKSQSRVNLNISHDLSINQALLRKESYEQEYSLHTLNSNLEREKRHLHNMDKIRHSHDPSFHQSERQRQRVLESKRKLWDEKENKNLASLGSKITTQDSLSLRKREEIKNIRSTQRKNGEQHMTRIRRRHLERLDQTSQEVSLEYEVYLKKQQKALLTKQTNINSIKQRNQAEKLKSQRAKEYRQQLSALMRQYSQDVLQEHRDIGATARRMKEQLEKYKQDKILMDFLSYDHVNR